MVGIMCESEEYPNYTTFKFLIEAEESKSLLKNNLEVFEARGFIIGSIGSMDMYRHNAQLFFQLDDVGEWADAKKRNIMRG